MGLFVQSGLLAHSHEDGVGVGLGILCTKDASLFGTPVQPVENVGRGYQGCKGLSIVCAGWFLGTGEEARRVG